VSHPHSLLIVDDDLAFLDVLSSELRSRGWTLGTAATGQQALDAVAASPPAVVLLDLRLPDVDGLAVLERLRQLPFAGDVIMLTGHGTIDNAIHAVRLGAFDYVSKPCPIEELEIRIRKALERQELLERNRVLESRLSSADDDELIAGTSAAFAEPLRLVERVAPTQSTVLILGETGSGKEMIARRLHARSPRAEHPFVVVECAALNEELLQSELFGHERGAYTGAVRAKPGLFEVAHGGTLFLDEIGEVSLATQVKLLRVLETSTFRHVGGTKELKVNVRVLAATHRNLDRQVAEGQFREDLLYRLDTVRIEVPPLRQRPEDLPVLLRHFLSRLDSRPGAPRQVAPEAMAVLERYRWPGNVRELVHVVEHALIVADDVIDVEHLPRNVRSASTGSKAPPPGTAGIDGGALMTLGELEHAHVVRVLEAVDGHRAKAARALGISERNLYRKLREYGLL
jgi:two-component system, NtrC family, response regulator AtoC